MNNKRWIGLGLAVTAAGLLIFASLSRAWLHNPRLDFSFGPRGCLNCCYLAGNSNDGCSLSNGEFVESIRKVNDLVGEEKALPTSGVFAPMGWAACVLCLLGALGLLTTAALAFLNRRPTLPVSPASIALLALMGALLAGCVFVATKPGPAGFVGIGNAFWTFGFGTVAGIAAAQMLAKLIRPIDPDLLEGAMNPDQY